jgi:TRAP-type C4-dicarboxylate transport system permease small subunit
MVKRLSETACRPLPIRNGISKQRWKSRLVDFVQWFDHGLDVSERCIVIAAILFMAAVSVINVMLRNLTGSSLLFANDLTQLLLVVVTFMGLGLGARHARHIRVSAIHDLLPGRAQKILLVSISLITAGLMFALAGWALDYAGSTQRSCRLLPENLTFMGSVLPLHAVPASLVLALVIASMAMAGKLIAALAGQARRLRRALPGFPGVALFLLSSLILILAGVGLLMLLIDLLANRTGSCRVMPSTGLPIYLMHLVVPLGLALAGLQFSLTAARNLISSANYLSWRQRDAYLEAQEYPDG